MNAWLYLALHDMTAIAGGVYLVTQDSPWWAALCFFLAAVTTVREVKK